MRKIFLLFVFVITFAAVDTFIIEDCVGQWVQMSNGIGNSMMVNSLNSSGNNIFAGTYYGLWLTTNNGQTWTQTELNNSAVWCLAISGNIFFAGCGGQNGVWLSTNNGQNWTQTALTNQGINSIAVSGNNIFAGPENNPYGTGGIWRSTNYGQNWTQMALNNQSVYCFVISGINIFAGTGVSGVLLSTNNGQNWTQTSLNNLNVYSLAISGNNIFAGGNGVYFSTNNGQNWTQTSLNKSVYSIAISGNNIFVGTNGNGVWLSTNNGQNWIEKNQGFIGTLRVKALLIETNYIFAGTRDNSVWRRSLSEIIGIKNISTEIPSAFSLGQNYPNPFNSVTSIKFKVTSEGGRSQKTGVRLKVYDLTGREVTTLVNERLEAGTYEVRFDASELASGIYFYKLTAGKFTDTKRMVLIK